MTFHIITIFPNIFDSYFNESILGRAQKNKLIKIKVHNLRGWTTDKHKTVDDTPCGGGVGMIMKAEPIYKAIQDIKSQISNLKSQTQQHRYATTGQAKSKSQISNLKTILLSAKGKQWNQQTAKKYSKLDEIILICGRYEGVDERVKKFIDKEISIGDYVLTGGEIPAMAIIDSITRLLPGVLGNKKSADIESHSIPGILEYPQYTKPETIIIKGKKCNVPKVLLSGNHKLIKEWRDKHKIDKFKTTNKK
ncbi:tRNA (guanosine(37)-N1)-methyltransferase TrmD [Patescibacteria group bacterium]|nr:tRNA (guanosine(37)-N1)-methyltransferase TrmD [Candidatus Falkowbacteria bacterium]MBU3906203.1 tRNA (guanosine(37)-N1)-methyltransferase TrmD [Patescibacteria group bacterium]MBU4014855.1 tRNA (guanosine(37)-N1)-methyltransferase TrmD [Patescibacteria group bacterium]MBU4026361.1 tRNA (guanosine(37)-N1)-methyltransferase TrmD [Patescibacteria group bacterium]MBU4073224.1 tRNA (guanosine(37)-N1)-methyltransferase TrmD [Patescibacteria group bacterium]